MATIVAPQTTGKLVGKRIRRKEDPRLITGTATYVEDIQMPGMHHACILRSPHAAAKIRAIDVQKAQTHPGVVAVFTGADTEGVGPVPCGASLPGTASSRACGARQRPCLFRRPPRGRRRGDRPLRGRRRGGSRSRSIMTPYPRWRTRKRRWRPERQPCIRNGRTTWRSPIIRKAANRTKLLPKQTSW